MAAGRVALALLAALSLWLSALPRLAALVAIATVLALGWLRIRRALARPTELLRIADQGSWLVLPRAPGERQRLMHCRVRVRGSLAWVQARAGDGSRHEWLWWPDTVDSAGLRKLRLAASGPGAQSAAAIATMPG